MIVESDENKMNNEENYFNSPLSSSDNIIISTELMSARNEFDNFFSNQTAYINLEENNKLLVLNIDLNLYDSVEAMISEEIACGLIWDSESRSYRGLFTIRDLLISKYILFDKIVKLIIKGDHWNNIKELTNLLMNKDLMLEELDIILESGPSFTESDLDDVEIEKSKKNPYNDIDVIFKNIQKEESEVLKLNSNVSNKSGQNIGSSNFDSNNLVNNSISNQVNSNIEKSFSIRKNSSFDNSNNVQQQKFKETKEIKNKNSENINKFLTMDLFSLNKKFSSYKDFFNIFNYISLKEYLTGMHNDIVLNNKIISVDLDYQLKDILKLMKQNLIHRVVVEDTKNKEYVGILTYESIFEYFINNYYNYNMQSFNVPYKKLKLGSQPTILGYLDDSLHSCFIKFWEARISFLPIMDCKNKKCNDKPTNIYGYLFLKDLLYLCSNSEKFLISDNIKTFLDELYSDVCLEKPLGKDRIFTIKKSDEFDFKQILEFMNSSPEKKIVIENDEDNFNLYEIITLTDIFKAVCP